MQRTITISAPNQGCTTPPGVAIDACSWNLCIVTTPFPEYPIMVCATKGNDEPPSWRNLYEAGNKFANGDVSGVQTWKDWYFFSYPNFFDSSRFGQQDVDGDDIRNKYLRLRVIAKGTTTYLNASRLYDGGRVICGQYPSTCKMIDTFNAKKLEVNMEKLVDDVIKRICVQGGASVDPETVRNMTKHTHDVNLTSNNVAAAYPHTHGVPLTTSDVGDVYKHTHDTTLTTNSVNNVYRHTHTTTLSGVDVSEVSPHTHTTNLQTRDVQAAYGKHSHDIPAYTAAQSLLRANDDKYVIYPASDETKPVVITVGETTTEDVYNPIPQPAVELKSGTQSLTETKTKLLTSAPPATSGTTSALLRSGTPIISEPVNKTISSSPGRITQDSAVKLPTTEPLYSDVVQAAEACLNVTKKGDPLLNVKLDINETYTDQPEWYMMEPPHTEYQLYYGDPKATTWEARKGTYQPMRIKDFDMANVATGYATFADIGDYKKINVEPTSANQTFTCNVPGTGTWAVAYYRNISLATSVTIKTVQYAEGVVNSQETNWQMALEG